MTDRLLTVKDVMEILQFKKTKATAIINSMPHVKIGMNLRVYERDLQAFLNQNMVTGKQKESAPQPKPRKRPRIEGLTEDGLIPYRRTKKGA